MRDFTFVFENHDPVIDFKTGLSTPVAFTISAPDQKAAVATLAAYGETLGWASDPADYEHDIDNGDITVLLPTRIAG